MKDIAKAVYHFPQDAWEILVGRRDRLTPPQRLLKGTYQNYATFKESGAAVLSYMIDLCELKPDGKVLDVGCGLGKCAVPLTQYLDETGVYRGFDVNEIHIRWCKHNISKGYLNFQFHACDVRNDHYHPEGGEWAAQYVFPYPDDYFDLVVLTSVFTHLLPSDLQNYLQNICRVLKDGGRTLISYFLLTDESRQMLKQHEARHTFTQHYENYSVRNPDNPEGAVGYDESYILSLYRDNRLFVRDKIHYGSWCGRSEYLSYQDFIVAEKDRNDVGTEKIREVMYQPVIPIIPPV